MYFYEWLGGGRFQTIILVTGSEKVEYYSYHFQLNIFILENLLHFLAVSLVYRLGQEFE